ncbi:mercury transporter MerT (plasmid) [Methylobacterium fujisawaense]|jgi:mercuric ion transport protein|uniref:mercury transporter MerT n=1 Tax=Methylobacterium fujisawaense TaxID=107400 RepID=UPI0031F56773
MALDQARPAERPAYEPAAVGVGSVAAFGAITGLGAFVASSCCVLPVVLGGLGAGAGVFTVLGVLAPLRTPLMAASVVAVVVGWFFYAHRRQAACGPDGACMASRRSTAALVLLSLATLLIAAAAAWGYFEPALIKMLRTA